MTKHIFFLTAVLALTLKSIGGSPLHRPLKQLSNGQLHFVVSKPYDWQSPHPQSNLLLADSSITLLVRQYGGRLIPDLIDLLKHDRQRDWAAAVVLYALTQRSADVFSRYTNRLKDWEKEQRPAEIAYWENFLKTSRPDQLVLYQLDGRYIPIVFTISSIGRKTTDTIELVRQYAGSTIQNTFSATLLVEPGVVHTQTLALPTDLPIRNEGFTFAPGEGDSLYLSWSDTARHYRIRSCSHPQDYQWFQSHHDMPFPDTKKGYDYFIKEQDDYAAQRIAVLENNLANGLVSRQAAAYFYRDLTGWEMLALLNAENATLYSLLPLTGSSIVPVIDLASLQQPIFSGDFLYTMVAEAYVHAMSHILHGQSTGARDVSYSDVNVAIDSLQGSLRHSVLYDLLISKGFHKDLNAPTILDSVFYRVEQLSMPAFYTAAIHRRYEQCKIEGSPLPAALLTATLLTKADGSTVSLASVIDSCRQSMVAIYFWDQPDLKYTLTNRKKMPVVDNRYYPNALIDIYLHDSQSLPADRMTANEYGLSGKPAEQALLRYLHIEDLPHVEEILLDKKILVKNPIAFSERTRLNYR